MKISAEEKLDALIHESVPSVLVIKELTKRENKEKAKMLAAAQRLAQSHGVPVKFISMKAMSCKFEGYENHKFEVASALANQFPFVPAFSQRMSFAYTPT